ncbi:metal-sulfur cluster biosynthetic enzyme [Rhodococcus sp. Leaf7]|uniref:iron-sulfur cluster assembly protein n=1 Tax=unclassified Rhodococcus (in: high G+C Gram-positive bacteria) TaxID=192944 RepID=UPI0006F46AB5|nr:MULTISPECIES: iron-sulfur cluster assembly protein [unclassified Rhodococcus (in: high G+C Gram-positive bacteria)]KQU06642.1 metal-sulfur cluster biosynthetic enzyme [Rhodococcus sp. Leaf7]KQU42162.1 metal-sulfur cluster biosynthetic enzyme [Rhodococcus sp. Leaf247]
MDYVDSAIDALGAVIDPELDEPITDLDFVESVTVSDDRDVVVHLRLPTSFCAPNFAYLMASDAKDVLLGLEWTRTVTVELDGHHDSPIINAGLAADAGYRGTFAHEAQDDLEELRTTFLRKAHVAAMERCLTGVMKADPGRRMQDMGTVRLQELPDDDATRALMSRRRSIGLGTAPDSLVMVDHTGAPYAEIDVPLALRRARSTRISIDGNAHFCRGLLRTRYDDPDRTTVSA